MADEIKIIPCEYHEEPVSMGCYCSAPGKCIYHNDYQILTGDIKGCRVNGSINPEDIPQHKRVALTPEQLEARIGVSTNHLSKL